MYGGRDQDDYVSETYWLCVCPCFGGIPNCLVGTRSVRSVGRY